MTVYGPYRRDDGRAIVIHVENGVKRTQSYPRYLLEQKLDRKLEPWEQVDHIDGDGSNNDPENLQILTAKENSQKSVIQNGREEKLFDFICKICKKSAQIPLRIYRRNQLKLGKSGPYCSKQCAGMVGK